MSTTASQTDHGEPADGARSDDFAKGANAAHGADDGHADRSAQALGTGDPNLTAHYARGAVDLWAHVHAGGMLQVADAGAERASTRLKAELDRVCKVAIYGVHFDFDKATLRPDATPALDAIGKLLTDYKDLKVELGGHTDNVGDRAYNQKLSEQRVGSVKAWLVKKGIVADRMTTRGYADTEPVVPNDSPANQARNRRVELKRLDCKPR